MSDHWCLGLPQLYSSDQSRGMEQANGLHLDHHHRLSGRDHCAFVATYLGQALGWYRADEGAGLIGAVVGAVIVLAIWGFIARSRSSV